MESKDIFLFLTTLTEINPSKISIKKLYSTLDDFTELFSGDLNIFKEKISKDDIERIKLIKSFFDEKKLNEIEKCLKGKEINFLAYSEKDYPAKLKEISDPAFGLFYRGNLNLLNNSKSVAIVGTRNPTNYGLSMSRKIASLLAEQKITIVSGLASGIDAAAHIGALESGKTIAVLGTGVDVAFPTCNKNLYEELLKKENLILSEYPPETVGLPWNFPQRNRIISALSDAVLVIEGDLQSGALITARFAIKQDKALFALPGPIDSPASNGPNILIKSGVAELLTSINDILEKIGEDKQIELDLKNNNEKLDGLSEKEKEIFKLLSSSPTNFDKLLQETNLSVQELSKHLSMLELKRLVEKTQDGGYVRA